MKSAVPIALLLVSACAQSVDAPSLAPRPAEALDIDAPSKPAPPPAPADAVQAALIARFFDQANAGNAAFEKALPAAATSAPPMSEAWIAAQNARSAVEIARVPTLDALAAIDVAIGDAIAKGQDAGALVSARAEIQAIADQQSAKLDALSR